VVIGAARGARVSCFSAMTDYLDYVRAAANGYVSISFPVEDGMEISCYCSGVNGRPGK
jgi:hypothetical protein